MSEKNFWFISLCALLIISANTEMNVFMRIALGANAIVVLIDVIKEMREIRNGRD